MKRPAGVVASAVILVLLSMCQILLGLAMLLAASVQRQGAATASGAVFPAWLTTFIVALCGLFLAFAAWGIATAISLYRLRSWARISILVIGGCVVFLSSFSIVGLVAAITLPQPVPPGADPAHAHSMQLIGRIALTVAALLYTAVLGVGVWWLVYFNRRSVRAVFAGTGGELVEGRRPLLISVYSVLTLLGAACCFAAMFSHLPGLLLWIVLHGWGKVAFYGGTATANLAVGIGLWRMREWARRLALGLLGFCALQTIVDLLRPSLVLQVSEETHRALQLPQPPTAAQLGGAFHAITFSASLLILLAVGFMLHSYRGRFADPGPPVAQPPALPV